MAIIYSYPINTTILATDIIVGSSTVLVGGRPKNQTKSFEIQDLAAYFASAILPPGSYVPYTGAVGSVNLGAYNLTATSIIKAGGTNLQYLMADGSISTGTFVPAAALTKTDDTNVTLTLGGSPATALLAATSLTLGWNGTLADSRITSAPTWNAKQDAITLTTIGTGAATFVANVLNIPTPSLTGFVPYTGATGPVNLGSYDLTVNGLIVGRGGGSYYGNTVFGITAGSANTSGINNSFVGFNAGAYNTTGSYNTALSGQALTQNLTGSYNTAIGVNSLYSNTLSYNTGVGYGTLFLSTTGQYNSAIGSSSGAALTTGSSNSLLGYYSGGSLTTASYNTFIGNYNGFSTNTGSFNTAVGSNAFQFNTSGTYNAALGLSSNRSNTTGIGNATFGAYSAFSNISGNYNTHIGYGAGYYVTTGSNNVYLGLYAGRLINGGGNNTTSTNSVFLGANTAALSDNQTNQIVIGNSATGAGSNTVTIGDTNITTTRLRGTVQGGSFVKDFGTVDQYLMADGSVTTSGPLFKSANSIGGTGVVSVISSAIVGSLFPDGSILRIQTMVTFGPSQTLNITPITYYINTSPSLVGATQIATFDISAGQRYAWMDRSFWSIANTFNSRNFLNSSQTSVSNSGSTLGSTSIPATFYIIASMNVGAGDLGTIASMLVEKI
jgi:hypothetical protein